MAIDHINAVERKLIDNLRNGTYTTTAGIDSGSAWASGSLKVFGQFPEPEDVQYPCIIVEQAGNGAETQFMGQSISSGNSAAIGEVYGLGFNIYCIVEDSDAMTVEISDASCNTTNTDKTVTMDYTGQITKGGTVSGSGIPAGATIASITNATTFELSAAATATATDETLTFSAPYKQRRLLNYIMLNCADILMDCDFTATNTEVVSRNYAGFSDIGYNPDLEIWLARTNLIVTFKNTR